MFNSIVGAGAALRYGSGYDQMMRLPAAPAPQHWFFFYQRDALNDALIHENLNYSALQSRLFRTGTV
jgi:hypothetical protein